MLRKAFYGIISLVILILGFYLFYNNVIMQDSQENTQGLVEVFKNTFEWGVGVCKSVGDYILSVFGGGGPNDVVPETGGVEKVTS